MERRIDIAVVSVPILSHQIAISEFCKKLVNLNPNFHITIIIPVLDSLPNASKSMIKSSSSLNIDTIVLPSVNLPQETTPSLKLPLSMKKSVPFILNALNSITSTTKLVSIVADYFAYEVFPFAKKHNILSYTYFPSSASVLSLCYFHSSILDQINSQQHHVSIPGCVPIHRSDLPTSFQDLSSETFKHFLLRSKGMISKSLCDGILVNSFMELEEKAVRAMMEGNNNTNTNNNPNPNVYMVGPIVQNVCESENTQNDSSCLEWLDRQTTKSVVFVSFGSGATLSQNQMNELALGLELSCQKFLWVVREPNDLASSNYFGSSSKEKDPLSFLPKGFVERTKGKGFVVPIWAPQVKILGHKAIGGFVTHCGWFSTIECVVNGLPIIAWPLFAEQRMIAAILVDGLNVAIRPKIDNESGIIEKGEIGNVLKRLMVENEGREIGVRMKVLQDASVAAIKVDGSSTTTLSQLVNKWTNLATCEEN